MPGLLIETEVSGSTIQISRNNVPGESDSAARNFGFDQQTRHDDRYELAEEYMEVCYKLWEQSWQNDAVRRDPKSGVVANPAKRHGVNHTGRYFKVTRSNRSGPPLQRTPGLHTAGA